MTLRYEPQALNILITREMPAPGAADAYGARPSNGRAASRA